MGNDQGLLTEQLRQFARFQRENPHVDPERLVDIFTSGTAAAPTEGNCVAPVPQRVLTTILSVLMVSQQENGSSNNQIYGHDGAPPTPTGSLEGDRSDSAQPMMIRYSHRNDPFQQSPSFTVDPADLSSSMTQHDAVAFLDSASLGVFSTSYVAGLGISEYGSFASPSMSRNPSGRSELASHLDSMGLSSSCEQPPFQPADSDPNEVIDNLLVGSFGGSFEPPSSLPFSSNNSLHNSNKRPSPDTVDELRDREYKRSQELHDERVNRVVNPPKSPKRPTESWSNRSTNTPTKPRYVRPKHPRIMCDRCPKSKGFRGDHEYRRHFERIHAENKYGWVVRDRSGTGLLSKCRPCSADKAYGVDYNAVAHLKRQHFNRDKDPNVKAPENIRDWIERVETKNLPTTLKGRKPSKTDNKTDSAGSDDEESPTHLTHFEWENMEELGKETSKNESGTKNAPAQGATRRYDEQLQRHAEMAKKISMEAFADATNSRAVTYSKTATDIGSVSQQVVRQDYQILSSSGSSVVCDAQLDAYEFAETIIQTHMPLTSEYDTNSDMNMEELELFNGAVFDEFV
ncbi:hypothetical protein K440DRAFT_662382 [Wilcoxina mikolae CBS 423.85]|nr:hypothetical protein K440DRAFT_662382 [Wilcoxina mikolae CBS 423.85]